MLWVHKRTVSMRRFFWAPKTYVKTDGLKNIYNFTLKNFVYLNLCFWVLAGIQNKKDYLSPNIDLCTLEKPSSWIIHEKSVFL